MGDGRSHDVVCAYGEAKMESSQGEPEGYLQGDARAVSRKGDRIEGICAHGSSRLVSDLQKSGRPFERLSTGSSSMTLMTFMTLAHLGHVRGSTFPNQVRDRLQSFG